MTKRSISPRENELLSLYLDQQLDSGQRARVEARLRADPELRVAYQDLRETRTLLRSLPRLKAPRNFTLTPEMVGRAKAAPPRRIYPMFQFASALASLLLVVVLLGDFLGLGARTNGGVSAPAPQEPGILTFKSAEQPETESAAEDLFTTEPPFAAQRLYQEPITATGEARGMGGGIAELTVPSPGFTPTITTTEPLSDTAMLPLVIYPEAGEEGNLGIDSSRQAQNGPAVPDRTLWRAAEISLAVLALSSGLAAIYLRRRYGAGR